MVHGGDVASFKGNGHTLFEFGIDVGAHDLANETEGAAVTSDVPLCTSNMNRPISSRLAHHGQVRDFAYRESRMEVDKEFEKDICFSCSNLSLFVFTA